MLEYIVAAHERRLRELDSLLPLAHPWPERLEGPVLVAGGAGAVVRERVDPGSSSATWRALDEHRLVIRVGGGDPVGAMDALLGELSAQARSTSVGPDSSVVIRWPSRDVAMTRLFLDRGLAPLSVLAVRPSGRPSPLRKADVRPFTAADIDVAVALAREELDWSAQFGQIVRRADSDDHLRASYLEVTQRAVPWTWIAEVDGRAAGLLRLEPPTPDGWASMVGPTPVAYLSHAAVTATHRGRSIGSSLVAAAHLALDAEGVAVTLLHYNGLNPLSGPFWHRCGYRPLWTAWEVRPACRMRSGDQNESH